MKLGVAQTSINLAIKPGNKVLRFLEKQFIMKLVITQNNVSILGR
jgi:hypothetical protein